MTTQEIDNFAAFTREKLQSSDRTLSLDDADTGRHRPTEDVLADLRKKHPTDRKVFFYIGG